MVDMLVFTPLWITGVMELSVSSFPSCSCCLFILFWS